VDGLQAVAACEEKRYDLVLMDGSMPELDGFDASRKIRASETMRGLSSTPVVALTAHVIGAGSDAWKDAGMDGVLHKPFTIAQIGAVLNRFLVSGGRSIEVEEIPVATEADDTPIIDPAVLAQFDALSSTGFAARVTRAFHVLIEPYPAFAK
jgi:CheY-like chemotaxis protein